MRQGWWKPKVFCLSRFTRLVSTAGSLFFEKLVFLFARMKLATVFFILGGGCITRRVYVYISATE